MSLGRVTRALRHPLRALVLLLAVMCVVLPFASAVGAVSAGLGVLLGVALGEAAGRSSLRTQVVLGLTVAVFLLVRLGVGALTQTSLAVVLGASAALTLAAMLGQGGGWLCGVALLRALSVRFPGVRAFEVGGAAAAVAWLFASHRDGVTVRPLWLSDFAWRAGFDPTTLLLFAGGSLAVVLALLLLLDADARLPRLGWLLVPMLAVVVLLGGDLSAWAPTPEAPTLDDMEPPDPLTGPDHDLGPQRVIGDEGEARDDAAAEASAGEDAVEVEPDAEDGGNDAVAEGERDDAGSEVELGEDGPEVDVELGEDGAPVAPPPGDAGAGQEEAAGDEGPEAQGDPSGEGAASGQPPSDGEGELDAPEVDPEGDGGSDEGTAQGEPEPGTGDEPAAGAAPDEQDGVGDEDQTAPAEGGGGDAEARDGGEQGDDGAAAASADEQAPEGEAGEAGEQDADPDDADDADDPPEAVDPPDDADPPEDPEPPDEPPDLDDQDGPSSDPRPVAIVLLDDDFEPPEGTFYFRQDVHSAFAGSRMVPASQDLGVDLDLRRGHPAAPAWVAMPAPDELRTVISGTVSDLVEHPMAFGLNAPVLIAPRPNPDPNRFRRSWRFVSLAFSGEWSALLGRTAGDPSWPDAVWAHYLRGPADPRYAELAASLVADLRPALADDPFARALAVKRHLDQGMTYDLGVRHAGSDDPTASFLFGDLVGYCVHSAHASVYLWRSLGIPARVATGYAVPAEERRGPSILIRSHQAHAWPELYLDGVGWVPLDTAPMQVANAAAEPLDEDLARQLAEMARNEPEVVEIGPTWPERLRGLSAWLHTAAGWALRLLGALLSVLWGAHYAAKGWRRLRPSLSSAQARPRVSYRAALDRLAEAGLSRRSGETREAHARRIAAAAPALQPLTRWVVAATYARPGHAPPPRPDWQRELSALRQQLSAAVPWWRRLLGLLDPTTLYRAH